MIPPAIRLAAQARLSRAWVELPNHVTVSGQEASDWALHAIPEEVHWAISWDIPESTEGIPAHSVWVFDDGTVVTDYGSTQDSLSMDPKLAVDLSLLSPIVTIHRP